MKKTEITLITFGIVLLILDLFFNFPGANALLIIPYFILSIIYFIFGFAIFNKIRFREILKKTSYTDLSSLKMMGAIFTGISLSITLMGILFKIMFWPGSETNLQIGIFSCIIIMIVGLIKYYKSKSEFYTKILKRVALFGVISLSLFFIPNIKLVEIKYKNDPEYAKALINCMENPDNQEYKNKLKEFQ